jgi:hypothetical protein
MLLSTTNSVYKKESTAQTYGQLILFPSQLEDANLNPDNQAGTTSPKEISVTLVPDKPVKSLNISYIKDDDRSKISLAAFSNISNKSVSISVDTTSYAYIESQNQDSSNASLVYQNIKNTALVVGSSYKTPTDLIPIISDSSKLLLNITLKSKESDTVEYNKLEQLAIKTKLVYNFYDPDETNIATQEDQNQDPLLSSPLGNVPRYVVLSWDVAMLNNPIVISKKIRRQSIYYKKPSRSDGIRQ